MWHGHLWSANLFLPGSKYRIILLASQWVLHLEILFALVPAHFISMSLVTGVIVICLISSLSSSSSSFYGDDCGRIFNLPGFPFSYLIFHPPLSSSWVPRIKAQSSQVSPLYLLNTWEYLSVFVSLISVRYKDWWFKLLYWPNI